MTHEIANNKIINNAILHAPKSGTTWATRNHDAWIGMGSGRNMDQPLASLIKAAARYADEYQLEFGSKVGDDGVLGEHWADIVRGLRGLLNGPLGRLDGGTMDKILLGMLQREGFEE